MRVLIANDGLNDAGGVNTYLRTVVSDLQRRGHEIAWIHCDASAPADRAPAAACWSVGALGLGRAVGFASAWKPEVCFSHNMRALPVERALLATAPVVKMMHGYFGTCVSTLKSFGWPARHPCSRTLGPACLALYLPRRCGRLNPAGIPGQYRFAVEQRELFQQYRAIVVASRHMKDEYVRGGAAADRVHTIPLFAPGVAATLQPPSTSGIVVFVGRMTPAKGGHLLVRAIAEAERILNRRVPLVMAGDGPEKARWSTAAGRASIDATFPGWTHRDALRELLARASLLVVPSTWPEPFGLVGLEAAAAGVPSVAFDVGGIREWLRDGESGVLAGRDPNAPALAAAIARVLADPALHARLSRGALQMARTLTIERHVDELERVFAGAGTAVPQHA